MSVPGFLGGEKATLLWDGLPAHRSRTMRAWLNRQGSWLVVERLPAYAPELDPVEGLWSNLKTVELANLTAATLEEVIGQVWRASSGSAARRIWPTRVPSPDRPVGGMTHQPNTHWFRP